MAFLPGDDDQDENGQGLNVLGDQQQQTDQPQTSTGPVGSTGAPTPPSVQASPQQQRGSGSFVNLNRFIQENQPATQKLAGAVTKGIEKEAGQVRKGLEKSQERFQQGLQQGQQRLQQSKDFAQQAVQKAGTGQLQDIDFQRFQNIASGSETFANVAPIDLSQQQAKLRALKSLAGRPESEQARTSLVDRTFKGPRRTAGQTALDTLLLGASPQASQQIAQQARTTLTELPQDIAQQRLQSIRDVQGLREQAQAFTGKEGEAFKSVAGEQGALQQAEAPIQQRITDRRQQLETDRANILGKLQRFEPLTTNEMESLGVTNPQTQKTLQGIIANAKFDVSKFLPEFDPTTVGSATEATEAERQRINALNRLIGREALAEGPANLQFDADRAVRAFLESRDDQGVTFDTQTGQFEGEESAIGGIEDLLFAPVTITKGVADLAGGLGGFAGGIVKSVTKPIQRVFCFAKDTMIHLADGTKKAVQDLDLGDDLLEGGIVYAAAKAFCEELYEYKNERVSGSHAVFENDTWIRVADSKLAKKLDIDKEVVYPICCENHLMITDNFVASDFAELDCGQGFTDVQQLQMLNNQTETNNYLSEKYGDTLKKCS